MFPPKNETEQRKPATSQTKGRKNKRQSCPAATEHAGCNAWAGAGGWGSRSLGGAMGLPGGRARASPPQPSSGQKGDKGPHSRQSERL